MSETYSCLVLANHTNFPDLKKQVLTTSFPVLEKAPHIIEGLKSWKFKEMRAKNG